jgi:hypothetical protein
VCALAAVEHCQDIVALHMCRDLEARQDPCQLIKSIAFQLSQRIAAYREYMKANISAILGAEGTPLSLSDLWEQLILAPFAAVNARVGADCILTQRRFAMIIDGLEQVKVSPDCNLMHLLASSRGVNLLPHWVGVIVTSTNSLPLHPEDAAEMFGQDTGSQASALGLRVFCPRFPMSVRTDAVQGPRLLGTDQYDSISEQSQHGE